MTVHDSIELFPFCVGKTQLRASVKFFWFMDFLYEQSFHIRDNLCVILKETVFCCSPSLSEYARTKDIVQNVNIERLLDGLKNGTYVVFISISIEMSTIADYSILLKYH